MPGSTAARHRRQPAVHLAPVDGPRRTGRGDCRQGGRTRRITARWRRKCVSCSGCSARRQWRTNCFARRSPELQAQKTAVALDLVAGGWTVSAVADALEVSHPHLSEVRHLAKPRRRRRPPLQTVDLCPPESGPHHESDLNYGQLCRLPRVRSITTASNAPPDRKLTVASIR